MSATSLCNDILAVSSSLFSLKEFKRGGNMHVSATGAVTVFDLDESYGEEDLAWTREMT
jgi:hypothetical protein